MRSWLLAAAMAAAAPAALAQATARTTQVTPAGEIQVLVGDAITVRLPASGRPEQVSVERAAPGAAAPPKPGAGFEDAPRGTVIITLQRTGASDILMKVQSGIDKAFDYRAQLMHEAGPGRWAAEPTSVCTVLPLLSSFESWPGREHASGIVLSEFKLKDTNGVVCPAPPKAK